MLKASYAQARHTAILTHSSIRSLQQACMLAIVATCALAASPAMAARSAMTEQAQLQLKSDQAAQAAERTKLGVDQQTLNADTKSGRMAAESKDAEKVYNDQLAIKGENKVIASDQPASLQIKEDHLVLAREQAQLDADQKTLKSDTKSGRMASTSKDAERVYKDHQFLKGEKKDIAADKRELQTL